MSWFSGTNPLDELVEKATDNSLPSDMEDLTLNLEICDRIRSKTVTAKDAMRSLKKRIGNKNPNVQLLALNLCDLCIKNGGSHFLVEITSREFVDNLLSLLRAPLGINHDVRERLLELIQGWALAFESRPELGYMMTVYQSLKKDGLQFPPEERVAAAFVDTAAPPDWADSDVCLRCRTAFTFRNRKHHCRNCGNVFCGQCSTQSMTLPQLGINEPVRVCDDCHAKRVQNTPNNSFPQHQSRKLPEYQSLPSNRQSTNQGDDSEDLDLKRALELSLAIDNKGPSIPVGRRPEPVRGAEDDDDADMKAAIEASLRDSAAKETSSYSYPTLRTKADRTSDLDKSEGVPQQAAQHNYTNPHEIQPIDQENIKLFAALVDRLKTESPGAVLRDPQIQELYEGISALRPKVARSLGDTVGKYESLVETHSKLATVVKYYDRMLEARLTATYNQNPRYGHHEANHRAANNFENTSAHSYYGQASQYDQTAANGYTRQQRYATDHVNHGYNAGESSQPAYPAITSTEGGGTNATYAHHSSSRSPQATQELLQPKEEVSLIDL